MIKEASALQSVLLPPVIKCLVPPCLAPASLRSTSSTFEDEAVIIGKGKQAEEKLVSTFKEKRKKLRSAQGREVKMRGGASARGMMECRGGVIIDGANEAEGRVAGPSPLLELCPCTFGALRSVSLAAPSCAGHPTVMIHH